MLPSWFRSKCACHFFRWLVNLEKQRKEICSWLETTENRMRRTSTSCREMKTLQKN